MWPSTWSLSRQPGRIKMDLSLSIALVSLDGESNWLEGAMLLAVYGILGLAFFFLPLKL